jgi:hypothetical protein
MHSIQGFRPVDSSKIKSYFFIIVDAFVAFGTLAGMIVQSEAVTKFSKAFRLVRILRLMIMIKPIRVPQCSLGCIGEIFLKVID